MFADVVRKLKWARKPEAVSTFVSEMALNTSFRRKTFVGAWCWSTDSPIPCEEHSAVKPIKFLAPVGTGFILDAKDTMRR